MAALAATGKLYRSVASFNNTLYKGLNAFPQNYGTLGYLNAVVVSVPLATLDAVIDSLLPSVLNVILSVSRIANSLFSLLPFTKSEKSPITSIIKNTELAITHTIRVPVNLIFLPIKIIAQVANILYSPTTAAPFSSYIIGE